MKKKLIVMILAAGLLTGCGKSIPKLANGEEALVEFKDGSKYSANEIWNEVKQTYALDIVLKKIDTKILESEYKDELDDVEDYIKNTETAIKANYPDENTLLTTLKQAGFNSLEDFLEAQRINYLTDMAITDFAKSKITDKQIKNYYKNEAVGDIHCLHILVKPDSSSKADDTKALNKAKSIIAALNKDIKSGTKALDAFKKYEKDETVTYQDLDYFNKGDMLEEFETAAFALKKGAISKKPVKTQHGYHVILKVDEKEKETLKDIEDEIRETLAEDLIEEDGTTKVNAMIELRKKHGVEWHDSELENAYNKYMNYLINQNK